MEVDFQYCFLRKNSQMDLRLAVADIAVRYQLPHSQQLRLESIAEVQAEPTTLKRNALAGIAVLGAALGGLGVIFWIAANWESVGRFGKFAMLQALVIAMCVGAMARPQARLPLSLIALLSIGGLFAYFGQTYQTGADPWQLFAIWAVLALPLCVSVRHDITWAPFALIVMTAISLWMHAHMARAYMVSSADLVIHLLGWAAAWLLCYLLGPSLRQRTGAGIWSLRLAVTLAVVMVALTAAGGLFASSLPLQFWLGLLVLLAAAALFSRPRMFDVFVLSALALPINGLLIGLLVRVVLDSRSVVFIMGCLIVGGAAAFLLSMSVKFILALTRSSEQEVTA